MIIRSLFLCAGLALAASTGAMAQTGGSAGNGMVSPVPSSSNPHAPAADRNPRTPGATGSTNVPGNTSTMAGDRGATVQQRTGDSSGSGGGGK